MSVRYGVRDEHIQTLEDRVGELEDVLNPFAEFGGTDVWKGTTWEKNPKTAVLTVEDDCGAMQMLFMEHFLRAKKVLMKGD